MCHLLTLIFGEERRCKNRGIDTIPQKNCLWPPDVDFDGIGPPARENVLSTFFAENEQTRKIAIVHAAVLGSF